MKRDKSSTETKKQLKDSSKTKVSKKRKRVTFEPSVNAGFNHNNDLPQGASVNKLIEVAQSHMSSADTERLGSITETLPIVHSESEIIPTNEAKSDRSITRDLAKKNLRKWNFFVKKLNQADHVQFPLRSSERDVTLHSMTSISAPTHPETSLERKLNEIYERTGIYTEEKSSSSAASFIPLKGKEDKDRAKNEDDLDPEEYVTTPNILAKLKAVMSYDVKKRQRANKIKSKQYHRMKRKEEDKARQDMIKKMYEIDPKAAALRQKQHLEKQRAYERATMRHKNTSKYIKHIKRSALWDADKREALDKQHQIHQERIEKPSLHLNEADSSDEEEKAGLQDALTSNPLPDDFIEKSRAGLQRMAFMQKEQTGESNQDDFEDDGNVAYGSDQNDALQGDDETGVKHVITQTLGRVRSESNPDGPVDIQIPQVTNDFDKADEPIQSKKPKVSSTVYPTSAEHQKEQEELIENAFADDEILQNLIEEKESAIEKEAKPVDANQALPGWNEWGGIASEDSSLNRKQTARLARMEAKRKIELNALRQKRRDLTLEHVYINEDEDARIDPKYIAKRPPYPFATQEQYEESVRLPLGKEWNTAMTVDQLTKPPVQTKKGKIIEPLDSGVRRRNTPRTRVRR